MTRLPLAFLRNNLLLPLKEEDGRLLVAVGNPANLHPLPPEEAGKRYVEFMGGADAVMAKAREYYDRGEYRWVVQVMNHVVFADQENGAARDLQAGAMEQLGYQSESAPWRNFGS